MAEQAEIELSILQRQCLGQRFADQVATEQAVHVWVATHDATTSRIDCHLTTADAPDQVKHLYPAYDK